MNTKKRKLTVSQALLCASLSNLFKKEGLPMINPFQYQSNAEMVEFTGRVSLIVERLGKEFCELLVGELTTSYDKPLLKRAPKPIGQGWKMMPITRAPEGVKLEVAVQGYDMRRGVVVGINTGSWAETWSGGPREEGISITSASNPSNVTLSKFEDDHIDLETARVDWWRVAE